MEDDTFKGVDGFRVEVWCVKSIVLWLSLAWYSSRVASALPDKGWSYGETLKSRPSDSGLGECSKQSLLAKNGVLKGVSRGTTSNGKRTTRDASAWKEFINNHN